MILVGVSALQGMAEMPRILVLDAAHVVLHRTNLMLETRSARRVHQGQALQKETQMPEAQTLVFAE